MTDISLYEFEKARRTASTPREAFLQSELQTAHDVIKTQRKRILELIRQKGRVERKAKQLDADLKHGRQRTEAYINKQRELEAAHQEIADLEETILSIRKRFGIEIDQLEERLDNQNRKLDTLTDKYDEQTRKIDTLTEESGKTNRMLNFVTEQMERNQRETMDMMSRHTIKEENSSDFEIFKRSKSVNSLPPIKKK